MMQQNKYYKSIKQYQMHGHEAAKQLPNYI